MSGRVQLRRVDEAYEAIRAHHHEHPYTAHPGQVYLDLGSFSSLLAALEHLTDDMIGAAWRATGSDDGNLTAARHELRARLEVAGAALSEARRFVNDAHINAGRLIFDGGAS